MLAQLIHQEARSTASINRGASILLARRDAEAFVRGDDVAADET